MFNKMFVPNMQINKFAYFDIQIQGRFTSKKMSTILKP